MRSQNITIVNGLDASAIAELVQLSNKFVSDVRLCVGERKVNCKSLMGLMSAGLYDGTVVALETSGGDEDMAVVELAALLSR